LEATITKRFDTAIETFVRGFSFTRSFTHPYVVGRFESVWAMCDAPRKRPEYRTEEWVAQGLPAVEVDRVVRANSRGRFTVCAAVAVDESTDACRDDYKSIGYRLRTTEPIMVHDLKNIPAFESPAVIERVTTAESAARLHTATRSRQILPEHLTPDAPLRQYVAIMDHKPVGWVRSISVGGSTWCSNMHVLPAYRRRGIAKALLGRMLRDDRKAGSTLAVLTASHTGALLYPVVGYRQVGTLVVVTPKVR
jgi:GNAT superfamily N-acetyltransferase